MSIINCPQCGTAHLATSKLCLRCQAPLIIDAPTNVAPAESTPTETASVAAPTAAAEPSPAPKTRIAPRPRPSRPSAVAPPPKEPFSFNPLFIVIVVVLLLGVVGYQLTRPPAVPQKHAMEKLQDEMVKDFMEGPSGSENSKSLSKDDPDAQDAELFGTVKPDFKNLLREETNLWGSALSSTYTDAPDINQVPIAYRKDLPPANINVCRGRVDDIELVDYKFSREGSETLMHVKMSGDTYKGSGELRLKTCHEPVHVGTASRTSVYIWKVGDRKWVPRQKMAKS